MRRMPPDVYFGTNQRVGWRKSDLITEMSPGLLVSDRLSLSLVSVFIYRSCRSFHSRSVVNPGVRVICRGDEFLDTKSHHRFLADL
jgi:hypothetical protein